MTIIQRAILMACLGALALTADPTRGFQSHYIPIASNYGSIAIAADPIGNIFILSATFTYGGVTAVSRVTKTDRNGNFVRSFDLTSPNLYATSLAINSLGFVFVGARELSNARFGQFQGYGYNAVIFKIDGDLSGIAATIRLGDGQTGGTEPLALAVDAADNVYVTGDTWAFDFPTTPGVFQTAPSPGKNPGPDVAVTYAYATAISPDLSQILFSTYLGGTFNDCLLVKTCVGIPSQTKGLALSFNGSGDLILAGTTTTDGFFNNPFGAPNGMVFPYAYGFVVKFSADLTSLKANLAIAPKAMNDVGAMTVDSGGNVWLTGYAFSGMPFTNKAPQLPDSDDYLVEIDANLTGILWGTYLGSYSDGYAKVRGVALDSGEVWITGTAGLASARPLPVGQYGYPSMTFFAHCASDGSTPLQITPSPFAGAAMTKLPGGDLAILGSSDSFLLSTPDSSAPLLSVSNSANNLPSGTIAPLELISLYGASIGPQSASGGTIVNGAFTQILAGYQVLFNGTPAPLLYAGPNQINVVAPAAISAQPSVLIQVIGPDLTKTFPLVYVAPQRPQVFSYFDPLAGTVSLVFNQDGTPNSNMNPAPKHSILTLWVTGAGVLSHPFPDGSMLPTGADLTLASPITVESVYSPPVSCSIEYEGQAPTAIQGLTQINFQLDPTCLSSTPAGSANLLVVRVANIASSQFTVYSQ